MAFHYHSTMRRLTKEGKKLAAYKAELAEQKRAERKRRSGKKQNSTT